MKVLYIVNNAAFFCSHRLPIALEAQRRGHEIVLVTGEAGSPTLEASAMTELQRRKIDHRRVAFRSGGTSPLTEFRGLFQLWRQVLRQRPDVVHCASPKGVLYGGLVARASGVPSLVLSVSGMGSLFTGSGTRIRRLIQRVYLALLRWVLAHPRCRVVVQNADDRALLLAEGLTDASRIAQMPGSGVDLSRFVGPTAQERTNLVVLPARLLREKGVHEFVDAARQLRGLGWRFALVGTADYDNPSCVSEAEVRGWVKEGFVEWWGYRDDMDRVYAQAKVVCLPSYREGMPKALLEAAAAGCAVVTTDTIGCREAIAPGLTGDLVPVGDASALARVLGALLTDQPRVQSYGEAGRRRAVEHFDQGIVIGATLALYEHLSSAHAGSDDGASRTLAQGSPRVKDTR